LKSVKPRTIMMIEKTKPMMMQIISVQGLSSSRVNKMVTFDWYLLGSGEDHRVPPVWIEVWHLQRLNDKLNWIKYIVFQIQVGYLYYSQIYYWLFKFTSLFLQPTLFLLAELLFPGFSSQRFIPLLIPFIYVI